jgi:hypothetical protein
MNKKWYEKLHEIIMQTLILTLFAGAACKVAENELNLSELIKRILHWLGII